MDRQRVCYAYGRHSTNKQELTQEVQEARTREYWQRTLAPEGVAWGGFRYDKATSARIPMGERPEGRAVFLAAQPGDFIVVSKMDRAFRSLRDGISSMDQWAARNVTFVTLDLQVDTSSPLGKFFRSILLAVAELEREFTRQRTQDVIDSRRKAGQPYCASCPAGWMIVKRGATREYRVDHQERLLISAMESMHQSGVSLDAIGLWTQDQKEFPAKRTFSTRQQARWAINAKRAGYPQVCNYKTFNRLVRSGEIALCQTQ